MRIFFLFLGIVFPTIVFGQRPMEMTKDIQKSLDSMSIIYKKNVSSYFVLETRDSVVMKVYYREKQYGDEKLLLTTREMKIPSRLSN